MRSRRSAGRRGESRKGQGVWVKDVAETLIAGPHGVTCRSMRTASGGGVLCEPPELRRSICSDFQTQTSYETHSDYYSAHPGSTLWVVT